MRRKIAGYKALVHDAVDLTVDLIEEGHESVARNALRVLGRIAPVAGPAKRLNELRRQSTALALSTVRGANRALERLTDAGLNSSVTPELVPWLRDAASEPITMRSDVAGSAAWLSDAALGALNGAVGDYLHRESNPLDLGFSLRFRDQYLNDDSSLAGMSQRLVVFVHGLGTTEWSWCYNAFEAHGDAAQCFGTLLEHDVGLTPLFARYNTGRRIAESGRALADTLQALFARHPVGELVLVGHSMGGLVVNSACHYAERRAQGWLACVTRVVSLGSPHQGAPLEQFSSLATVALDNVDLPGTRIPAALLRRRSAGVQDLARGTLVDDDATPELLEHIEYTFVSATVTQQPRHPLGLLIGDVMVRVPSASGPTRLRPSAHFEAPCLGGLLHQELQSHPEVYAVLKRVLADSPRARPEAGEPD